MFISTWYKKKFLNFLFQILLHINVINVYRNVNNKIFFIKKFKIINKNYVKLLNFKLFLVSLNNPKIDYFFLDFNGRLFFFILYFL